MSPSSDPGWGRPPRALGTYAVPHRRPGPPPVPHPTTGQRPVVQVPAANRPNGPAHGGTGGSRRHPPRAPHVTRMYRRRRATVFTSLLAFIGVFAYLVGAVVAPDPAVAAKVTAASVSTGSGLDLAFPSYGTGAIGIVGQDGLIAGAQTEKRVPMASITKIVTALVVLQKKPLAVTEAGPTITYTAKDVRTYQVVSAEGGSTAPVVDGMTLSERQTIETMILPSANNYAYSLARWAFGSTKAYLAATKTWLKTHHLTHTVVTDPSGLKATTESTPADLVHLGELALQNPVVAAVVASTQVDEPTIGTLNNSNALLGTLGVDGIKTGTSTKAGYCLLFSADISVDGQTRTVVGVLLGGISRTQLYADVRTALTAIPSGFGETTLVNKGDVFGTYTTAWGSRASLVATETKTALTWKGTKLPVAVSTKNLSEGSRGQDVGSAVIDVAGSDVSVPLALSADISGAGAMWRILNPFSS